MNQLLQTKKKQEKFPKVENFTEIWLSTYTNFKIWSLFFNYLICSSHLPVSISSVNDKTRHLTVRDRGIVRDI